MDKIRIGIFFGGTSREREVSFAGGRTVYDNLDKALFEPIPVFVDSFGNFVLLNWEFIYKGSIRDFYPSPDQVPLSVNAFQVYAECLGDLDRQEQVRLINKIGSRIELSALSGLIDMAFLCLHGSDGEDGRIQGLLEYYRIPYTGSGILSSAIGMDKASQRHFMRNAGFRVPETMVVSRKAWELADSSDLMEQCVSRLGLPFVVKSANQGSSIGVTVVSDRSLSAFSSSVDKSFFLRRITKAEWDEFAFDQKVQWVREVSDIRDGIGLPLMIRSRQIHHPEELLSVLIDLFSNDEYEVLLSAASGESTIIAESFISGREFSCIVIQDEDGTPIALPPTEIRKGKELYDYRSKYLPGLSRKVTPIDLDEEGIQRIRSECQRLFDELKFSVYARIDGFISDAGEIVLNDPNTTSGMMPSSFFFHQAAEIGLNPTQFITFIIHRSLRARLVDFRSFDKIPSLVQRLDKLMDNARRSSQIHTRAVVILGGYSSERHISVESGRNIYEKLASSPKYQVTPIFLTGNSQELQLFSIPINLLLKDNADDIREKVFEFNRHPIISRIIEECKSVTERFASLKNLEAPQRISLEDLPSQCDIAFIALHGRPGEDGSIQKELDRVGLPYNGSGPLSSQTTIDKYKTNELLAHNGFHVAGHYLGRKADWLNDSVGFIDVVEKRFGYPCVAKPVDDGCSSAVRIIRSREQLSAYASLIFRGDELLDEQLASTLNIKFKEEFPFKDVVLFEELIRANGAQRFIEITGGMLTSLDEGGRLQFEVFEASEALSEGDVLSLEEKFLAGQGQNITPARYSDDAEANKRISTAVKKELERAARLLHVEGYARIDAFVRIFNPDRIEVVFIEVNSLPGMTPATCIFHQAAIAHYKPFDFIDKILDYGQKRKRAAEVV